MFPPPRNGENECSCLAESFQGLNEKCLEQCLACISVWEMLPGYQGNVLRFVHFRYVAYGTDKRVEAFVFWMPAVPCEAPVQKQHELQSQKDHELNSTDVYQLGNLEPALPNYPEPWFL